MSTGGRWFFWTFPPGSRVNPLDPPDPLKRWLVLDFTKGLDGSQCHNLDQKIFDGVAADSVANAPGGDGLCAGQPLTDFLPPVNPDPCIDNVEWRWYADRVLKKGAKYQPMDIRRLRFVRCELDKDGITEKIVWRSGFYRLEFVNPLKINQAADLSSAELTTTDKDGGDLSDAELWGPLPDGTEGVIGRYNMPFLVKVTRSGTMK